MAPSRIAPVGAIGLALLSASCLSGGGGGGGAVAAPQTPILPVAAAAQPNQAPVETGWARTVAVASGTTTLSISASDPEGGTLTYAWTADGGPAPLRIASPAQASTVVEFPLAGSYAVTVVVRDGQGASLTRSATITVDPGASFTIQASVLGAGSGAGGSTMALTWIPAGRAILTRSCDAAGLVAFSGLMGQPDDFTLRVLGTP